jgi:hypothetical protein
LKNAVVDLWLASIEEPARVSFENVGSLDIIVDQRDSYAGLELPPRTRRYVFSSLD